MAYPSAYGDGWHHYDGSFYNEDTIRIFTTYMLSDADVIIPLQFSGDDGYTIYLDDMFFTGNSGIGPPPVNAAITLFAGVPLKFEAAIYNGPGPTHLTFLRQDDLYPLDTTPGVRLNAVGDFPSSGAVPEPQSVIIWSILLVGVTLAQRAATLRRLRVS